MTEKDKARRRYDSSLKAKVLRECARPGAIVAGVASAHGLKADVVHKWRYQARQLAGRQTDRDAKAASARASDFIALGLPSSRATAAEIHIEVQRGSTVITVDWPTSEADRCAALLAQCLR